MTPGLYLVGTPIGNLSDIAERALETLREADVILAEDTRHTRKLLSRYDIHTKLVSYHKFNEAARVDAVLSRIQQGAAVALVSDAGMPCISDPGARMVSACHDAGVLVTVLPGPSSVSAALAVSGMCFGPFVFEGFLPPKSGGRLRRLSELAEEQRPVVLFESPYRLLKLLALLQEVMPDRRVCVAREMTKRFEQVNCGIPAELIAVYDGRTVKGEIVLVLEGIHPKRG